MGYRIGWAPQAVVRHRVPASRNTPDRVRFYSLQLGCSLAYLDWKHLGTCSMICLCLARLMKCALVEIPLLLLALLFRHRKAVMDHRARLSRATGYTRKTLALVFPRLLAQERFFNEYVFRKVR